jgi:membrane-associated protein
MFLDPDLGALTAVAVYAVVWGFIFAESGLLLGFLLPGDTLLFGAGLVAASPDSGVNIVVMTVGCLVAAIAGNEVGYYTGRRFGRTWLENREKGRAREQLRRAEVFYDRYGWWSVVVARWIPWVRTFIPIIAGAAAMDRRAYSAANVVGALPWAGGLPILGYFAAQLPVLRTISYVIAGTAIVGTMVAAVIVIARDRRAKRAAAATSEGTAEGTSDETVDGSTGTDRPSS